MPLYYNVRVRMHSMVPGAAAVARCRCRGLRGQCIAAVAYAMRCRSSSIPTRIMRMLHAPAPTKNRGMVDDCRLRREFRGSSTCQRRHLPQTHEKVVDSEQNYEDAPRASAATHQKQRDGRRLQITRRILMTLKVVDSPAMAVAHRRGPECGGNPPAGHRRSCPTTKHWSPPRPRAQITPDFAHPFFPKSVGKIWCDGRSQQMLPMHSS